MLFGKRLLLHYDFEGVSGGIVPDVSGNGYNGTMLGGTLSYNAPQGSVAVQTPYISLPNSGTTPAFSLPNDAFSIATWVQFPVVSTASTPARLIDKSTTLTQALSRKWGTK